MSPGEAGSCLAIPGFALLFVITGSMSYFGNKLVARFFKRASKQGKACGD